MSGHSKWSQIKRQKGITDKKKSGVFSKISKTITVAARQGDNPDFNFKLRLAIDQARTANMPKDNVKRAIEKGAKKDGGDATLEEITYEGFGPGGTAFLVETITDNRNRTASFLKSTFSKFGGNMGSSGSVQWMFQKKGVMTIPKSDENELATIDAGAEDMKSDGKNLIVFTSPEKLETIKKQLMDKKIEIQYASIEYIASEELTLSEQAKNTVDKLYQELEDNEDINAIHSNIK